MLLLLELAYMFSSKVHDDNDIYVILRMHCVTW